MKGTHRMAAVIGGSLLGRLRAVSVRGWGSAARQVICRLVELPDLPREAEDRFRRPSGARSTLVGEPRLRSMSMTPRAGRGVGTHVGMISFRGISETRASMPGSSTAGVLASFGVRRSMQGEGLAACRLSGGVPERELHCNGAGQPGKRNALLAGSPLFGVPLEGRSHSDERVRWDVIEPGHLRTRSVAG